MSTPAVPAALDPDADARWMDAAIAAARRQPAFPFGAVLVDEDAGLLVATGWNQGASDPTGHGEMDVIRRTAEAPAPPDWERLTLFTTAEPCPMCAGAIVWAGLRRVVYGVDIPWLIAHGWFQMSLRAQVVLASAVIQPFDAGDMAELDGSRPGAAISVRGGVRHAACAALFLDAGSAG